MLNEFETQRIFVVTKTGNSSLKKLQHKFSKISLGFKPSVTGWKALTNPLSFGKPPTTRGLFDKPWRSQKIIHL